MSETRTALHYASGQWTNGPDVVMEAWHNTDSAPSETVLRQRLEYEELFEVGDRYNGGFAAWAREDSPRYVLAVGDDHLTEYIYPATLPDLYDLAARWSPLVRDQALLRFLKDIQASERHMEPYEADVLTNIGRRIAQGTQETYERRG
ncbi:hypothetical protein AB0C69_10935 [Actinomadura sp. NPDC048032]|uniref:hypothetical protein n=1 Tax=Actinomadura sp. NPDC048032 TaxID=3155747 RepID=UPI0033D1CCAE